MSRIWTAVNRAIVELERRGVVDVAASLRGALGPVTAADCETAAAGMAARAVTELHVRGLEDLACEISGIVGIEAPPRGVRAGDSRPERKPLEVAMREGLSAAAPVSAAKPAPPAP